MIIQIAPSDFLKLACNLQIIDVRSENEYRQGHIPGAFNLPLFNNKEREIVGTLYKNSGRETSVLRGLELVGPKLAEFVKGLHKITNSKHVLVYCWRGGMRSESMGWLFNLAGYDVSVLEGGYKAYRQLIRERLKLQAKIIILGGLTGSGKTQLLHSLAKKGDQILDLESIAHHKGSVFGGYGQADQPTNEQFENDIYSAWEKMDFSRPVWLEDESRAIGNVSIPDPLFDKMGLAPMIKIEVSRDQRIKRILDEYATLDTQNLKDAILKISEKLGGTNMKTAITALETGDFEVTASLALSYYDKTYSHSISKRANKEIIVLPLEEYNHEKNVDIILKAGESLLK